MSLLRPAGRAGRQSHLTIAFPIPSPAGAKSLAAKLPSLMPCLARASDAIGTVHDSCFVVLSERTLLFLADFDGDEVELLRDLAEHAGPVFDAVWAHVHRPPPEPAARNVDAFLEWAMHHRLRTVASYAANPTATVRGIKSRVAAAHLRGTGEQLPFLVILPLRSRVSEEVFRVAEGILADGSHSIGRLHFVSLVLLEDRKLGFFTIYDGPFDKFIPAFAEKLGPVFDLLFEFAIDPPPTPSAGNAGALIEWVVAHVLPPLGMYQAYPSLRVQDVSALEA
jgi:hypothetical protein